MTRVVYSEGCDANTNLALEEALFAHSESTGEIILYLWQNDKSVIIGRNQNIYTECNISEIYNNGCKIARRMTGGGAVFHDLGNLNYTFIMPKDIYGIERQTRVIQRALLKGGINVTISGRNDLVANEFKISGNAYYSGKKSALHHGTVLLNVDLNLMDLVLNSKLGKMSKKGIQSVKSRVINGVAINPLVSLNDVKRYIEEEFLREYITDNDIVYGTIGIDDSEIEKYVNKYMSYEWTYGFDTKYDFLYEKMMRWGLFQCQVTVIGAKDIEVTCFSDSLFPRIICAVENGINAKNTNIFCELRDEYSGKPIENMIINDIESIYEEIIGSVLLGKVNTENV